MNDAPVLNAAGNPKLASIFANVADANNFGTLVSDLISSMGPAGGISDVDAGFTRRIGVIGANQNNGVWQFSTNGGTNWTNFGGTSSSNTLLLGSTTRIRFKPNPGFTGSVGLTFVAWDLSSGTIGETINAIDRGLSTSLSMAKETAYISVTLKPSASELRSGNRGARSRGR